MVSFHFALGASSGNEKIATRSCCFRLNNLFSQNSYASVGDDGDEGINMINAEDDNDDDDDEYEGSLPVSKLAKPHPLRVADVEMNGFKDLDPDNIDEEATLDDDNDENVMMTEEVIGNHV